MPFKNAKQNPKKPLLQALDMLEKQKSSAVRLDGSETLVIKFKPKHRAGRKRAEINLA